MNSSCLARMRLSKTLTMPASLTSLPRPRAWAAAPEHLPPQPIIPILISCLPAAWAEGAIASPPIAAAPAAAVLLRNSLRDALAVVFASDIRVSFCVWRLREVHWRAVHYRSEKNGVQAASDGG